MVGGLIQASLFGASPPRATRSRAPPARTGGAQHLGYVLPAEGSRCQRRHRRRGLRSLPSLRRRHRADARSRRASLSVLDCVAARPADGPRQRERAWACLLRPTDRRAPDGRNRAVDLPLSLGFAAGAGRSRRLDQPRLRRLVRRLRNGGRAPLRRQGQTVCDVQRADAVYAARLRFRLARSRAHRPIGAAACHPSRQPGPRSGRRGAARARLRRRHRGDP